MNEDAPVTRRLLTPAVLTWLLAFSCGWWLLAGNDVASWAIGLPAVLAATASALWMGLRLPAVRWLALPRFIGFFIVKACTGSFDVAYRALSPRPVSPEYFRYPLNIQRGQLLLATLISALPGTLTARVENGELLIHALVDGPQSINEVAQLEAELARLLPSYTGD